MTPRFLTRHEAAQYLTGEGFPCASKTLAKLACQGGGPPFIKFGLRVLYRPDDLISWAVSRCCWRSSTSDPGGPLAPPGAPSTPNWPADIGSYAGVAEPATSTTDGAEGGMA